MKFCIKVVEGLYSLCSENKGADQLRGYREADLRLCFRICKLLVFPQGGSNIGVKVIYGLCFIQKSFGGVIKNHNQRTIGPENAHLKPDLGVLSHNEMTLTLNTHTPLLTS